MKKIFIILFIVVLISMLSQNEETIRIPEESIRFRIIANSNNSIDQKEKMIIAKELENTILKNIEEAHTIEESRKLINDNLPLIDNTLNSFGEKYSISFGNNYFPIKEYKGIKYDAGVYESLVITLGEGKGDNFWCVLFPPLCLLEAKEQDTEEVEYKSLVKEILDKI